MDHFEPEASARREARSTRAAIIAFVLAGIAAVLLAQGEHVPLGGPGSLGTRAGWLSGVLAAVAFAGAYLLPGGGSDNPSLRWRQGLPPAKRLIDLIALTAATGMSAYLVVIAVAQVFQFGFRGLTVDPLGGGALAGFAAGVLSYAAALFGAKVTSTSVAALGIGVLFMGTLASMVSSPDESWWQLHFSQLGNTEGVTGYRFNLALILTGLVITTLANFVGHAFARGLTRRGGESGRLVPALSWIFAGIGGCMMVAGFVPDAVSFAVHVGGASGMIVLFAVFVFVVLRRVPDLPRDLVVFTFIVIAGIIVSILLWVPVGYYNLTGMELVAAGLLFTWLFVFVRAAEAYASDSEAPFTASPRG
ncbi:DUF998 domain-containing protein [Microbacterium aurum]